MSRPEREPQFRRPHERALGLVLVLVLPAFAGCLGGEESGPPDDLPIGVATGGDFAVPSRLTNNEDEEPPAEPKSPEPDPRLNVTARWFRGDWWYYESNHTRHHRILVEDIVFVRGVPFYKVRYESGLLGGEPQSVVTKYVTTDFGIVNETRDGGKTFYSPPNREIRFLPGDNTFSYNETGYTTVSGGVYKWAFKWSVRVTEAKGLGPLEVAAGVFNVSHFRIVSQKSNGEDSAFFFKERWYSPDLRADAMFVTNARTEDAELWNLVAYRLKGERGGKTPGYLPY